MAAAVGLPGRGLDGVAGILWATLAIFAALLLVPVLDRSPERAPARRLPIMIAAALVVAVIIA